MNIAGKTHRRKYGVDFFPHNISDVQIELLMWKHHREEPYCHGNVGDPWEFFLRGARMVLTPEQFNTQSRWTIEHAHDWTMYDFIVTWGSGGSSKSNDYGCMAYFDWSVDPKDTYIILGSTSLKELKTRSFESVVRYHKILKPKGFPGKLSKTATAILLDDSEDETATDKAAIRGVAVQEGTEDEARANLRGGHLPYVTMIGDEFSQMRAAFVSARTNLRIGTKRFRFAALTNIDDFNDQAGQYSVPKGGWSTVNQDVEFWETQWGVVRRHDARRSPAIVEPDGEKMFPFLPKQKDFDDMVREEGGNEHAPQIYVMWYAWPPPQGKEMTVMSAAEALTWKIRDPVTWESEYARIASLDPAFGGGDHAKLAIGAIGMSTEGRVVLKVEQVLLVPIDASSMVPKTQQISNFTRVKLTEFNVPLHHVAVDDSGTQSVADVIEMDAGQPGVLRILYNGRPSDLPVSAFNPQPCRERYANKITELYYGFKEFAMFGQLRSVPEIVVSHVTKRRLKAARPPFQLEDKGNFKKNIGLGSPDDGDAVVGLVAVARERLGLIPGATRTSPSGPEAAPQFFSEEMCRYFDVDTQSKLNRSFNLR